MDYITSLDLWKICALRTQVILQRTCVKYVPQHTFRSTLNLSLQRLDQQDVMSWQWVAYHERIVVQVWHTKQGVFRRKLPPDVRDDPMRGQPRIWIAARGPPSNVPSGGPTHHRAELWIRDGISWLQLIKQLGWYDSNAHCAYLYSCG